MSHVDGFANLFCGALTLNYVEARRLSTAAGRVRGLVVADLEGGGELEIRTPLVVSCAGPWCGELAARLDRDRPELCRPALAFNLLLDRVPPSDCAVAVRPPGPGARIYFMRPAGERLLAGTYHAGSAALNGQEGWDRALVERMLEDLNAAIPSFELAARDVLRVYPGRLRARRPGGAETARRPVILEHDRVGGPAGLVSVDGPKFTTARSVAELTLRRVWRRRGESLAPIGGEGRPPATRWPALESLAAGATPGVTLARLMEEESALHLDDLLLRRAEWAEDPRRLQPIADQVAGILGWEGQRRARELALLQAEAV